MKSSLSNLFPARRFEGGKQVPNSEAIAFAHGAHDAITDPRLPSLEGYVGIVIEGSWMQDYARRESTPALKKSDFDPRILIMTGLQDGPESAGMQDATYGEKMLTECKARAKDSVREFETKTNVPVSLNSAVINIEALESLCRESAEPEPENHARRKDRFFKDMALQKMIIMLSRPYTGETIFSVRKRIKGVLSELSPEFRAQLMEKAADTAAGQESTSFQKRDAALKGTDLMKPEERNFRFTGEKIIHDLLDRLPSRRAAREEGEFFARYEQYRKSREKMWHSRLSKLWL